MIATMVHAMSMVADSEGCDMTPLFCEHDARREQRGQVVGRVGARQAASY